MDSPDGRETAQASRTRQRAQAVLVAWPIAMVGWVVGADETGWTQHIGQAVFIGGLITVIALGGAGKRSRVLATEAGWSAGTLQGILLTTMMLFMAGLAGMIRD